MISIFHRGLISTRISNLAACLEVPIWNDFILVSSIKTVTVKTDIWNHFQLFLFISTETDFPDQIFKV